MDGIRGQWERGIAVLVCAYWEYLGVGEEGDGVVDWWVCMCCRLGRGDGLGGEEGWALLPRRGRAGATVIIPSTRGNLGTQ